MSDSPENIKPSRKELKRGRQETRRQAEQYAITRRELLRNFIITGISLSTLGVAGVAWHLGSKLLESSPKSNSQQPEKVKGLVWYREQHQKDEASLAKAINETDQAMELLEKQMTQKITGLPTAFQNALKAPLDSYNINRGNPYRNSYTFLLQDLEKRGEAALLNPAAVRLENLNYFFMRLLEGRTNVAGSFSPSARTLHLGDNVSSSNLFDALVIFHEAEHARQDFELRRFLTNPGLKTKYDAFYSGAPSVRPRILISCEYQAYAKEIEALNILTDGALKNESRTEIPNVENYRRRLNARPDQKEPIEAILQLAPVYYSSGSTIDGYRLAYTQTLNQLYIRQGYSLYTLTDPVTLDIKPLS